MKQKHSKQAIKQRRSRLIVALFVLLVVISIVGIGVLLSVPSTNFQPHSTQQPPDDFELTATALIGQLTEDAIIYQMTQQPDYANNFALTATALMEQVIQNNLILTDVANGLITLTPTPTLLPLDEVQDDFALTATTLIGQLTEDAIIYQMTQQPDYANNFALTATALMEQVIQNNLILTDVANGLITLTPTPTLLPLDEVQDKWLVEIENEVGFSHSEIEIAAGKLAEAYEQDLQQANREKLNVESRRYFADDRSFVAMMIRTISTAQPSRLFVFEQIDDEFHLLDEQILGYGYFIGYQDEVFIDLNQSGNINLVYGIDEVQEDCRVSKLTILEFTSDGIVDISPASYEQPNKNVSVFNIVDVDNDGLFEIEDPSPRVIIKSDSELCPINREPIYYQWDGERYSLMDG